MENSNKLIVVRRDGSVQKTEFIGYLGESAADYYFNVAKEDERTIFACTIENGDGRRQFFASDERAQ